MDDILSILNAPQQEISIAEFEKMMQTKKTAFNDIAAHKNSFVNTSRAIWKEMRSGSPFEYKGPTCGEFIDDFYGQGEYDGFNIPKLIDFIKSENKTNMFNWEDYKIDSTKTRSDYLDEGNQYTEYEHSNTISLDYLMDDKKTYKKLSPKVLLNKRVCYIESNSYFQKAVKNNINGVAQKLSMALYIHYQGTENYRTGINGNRFNLDNKYEAIIIESSNIEDILYIIGDIYGESSKKNFKDMFKTDFLNILKGTTNGDALNFLYKNAPEFVLENITANIDETTLFNHLEILSKFDEDSWFDDSSKAVLKLLKSITPKRLYKYFKENPYQLKRIFYNLDNASNVLDGENVQSNKTNFANLLTAIAQMYGFESFEKETNLETFYVGNNYEIENKIDYDNDPDKNKYFLQQMLPYTKTIIVNDGDEKVHVFSEKEVIKHKKKGQWS